MTRFVDEYLADCVPGYPVLSTPRWSTALVQVDSGREQANQRWAHPLHRFTLPEAVRDMTIFNALRDHWLVMRGPFHSWPFRDPLDYASVALSAPNPQTPPTVSATDQTIGTGDGVTAQFQLIKEYARGAQTYTRDIIHPVTASVAVALDGVDPLTLSPAITWSVSRTTGIVTFDTAPGPGVAVTAGYLFDVEVRFEADDSFDGVVRTFSHGGFSDINLIEIRPC